ncbi:MAG: NfeD family protein [Planctomycetota bacterium]
MSPVPRSPRPPRPSPGRSLLLAALALAAGLGPVRAQAADPKGEERALIVPIEGEIGFRTVALLKRAFRRASSIGASRVFLEIDTPGGRIDSTEEIVTILDLLREEEVQSVAWIRKDGLSAGALIALACNRIMMADGSRIGAATPIGVMETPSGPVVSPVEEKFVSAFRAEVRALAEKNHGKQVSILAEAMVDGRFKVWSVRYKGEDGVTRRELLKGEDFEDLKARQVQVLEARLLNDGDQPLTLTAGEAIELGLAVGRANGRDELLREYGLEPRSVAVLGWSWSEELAGFLYSIRFFLLVGALLMIAISFQIPGTGLPEILALLLFGLFFAGSWLVGLAELTEILLFGLGVILLLVEIFIIPGTLIAGVAGAIAIFVGLFLSLQSFGGMGGGVFEQEMFTTNLWRFIGSIVVVVLASFALSRLLPKLPWVNRLLLEANRPGDAPVTAAAAGGEPFAFLVGRDGEALTDLRPAGKVAVDGEPYDVVTEGRFVERGQRVRVLLVRANRIVVERSDAPEAGEIAVPWLVLLMCVGMLLIVAEVFIPSMGVLSILSAVTIVTTVFLSFQHGTGVGLGFLVSALVTVPVVLVMAFRLLPRTPFGRRLILQGPSYGLDEDKLHAPGLEDCIGRSGRAENDLHPVGTISIDGKRYDAKSRGELIEAGARVRVLAIELSQLVVTTDTRPPAEPHP